MIDFLLLTNQIFCCLVQDKDLAFDALLTCQNGQQPGKLLVDVADKLKTRYYRIFFNSTNLILREDLIFRSMKKIFGLSGSMCKIL